MKELVEKYGFIYYLSKLSKVVIESKEEELEYIKLKCLKTLIDNPLETTNSLKDGEKLKRSILKYQECMNIMEELGFLILHKAQGVTENTSYIEEVGSLNFLKLFLEKLNLFNPLVVRLQIAIIKEMEEEDTESVNAIVESLIIHFYERLASIYNNKKELDIRFETVKAELNTLLTRLIHQYFVCKRYVDLDKKLYSLG